MAQEVSFPADEAGNLTGIGCTNHVKAVRMVDPCMEFEVAVHRYQSELPFQAVIKKAVELVTAIAKADKKSFQPAASVLRETSMRALGRRLAMLFGFSFGTWEKQRGLVIRFGSRCILRLRHEGLHQQGPVDSTGVHLTHWHQP